MENGEPSSRSVDNSKQQPDNVKKIKIRFSVFFDGTLNNRTNINQRLLAAKETNLTEEEQEMAQELKSKTDVDDIVKAKMHYKMHGSKDPQEDNSYEGYYTNIVLMEKYVDPNPPEGYNSTLKIYIEGSGTIDETGDETSGFAFAIWESGIPAKVQSGVNDAVAKIKESEDQETIIDEITFDVFGFSRGAAAARSFIHYALFGGDEYFSVKMQLKELGYTVHQVNVCFAGLYDTVSTYGFWKTVTNIGASNTQTLKLDAITHAKKVVQLASADEHRKYFSLTNIKSARSKGREIFLPGVHSDIGGGYRDNGNENEMIYEDYGYSRQDAEKDLNERLASGWFKPEEIVLTYEPGYENDESDDNSVINVIKKDISNKYSRIPLHIMTKYARENKVKFKRKLEVVEEIPSELNDIKQQMDNYIAIHQQSKAEHWHGNTEQWLRDLRHDYFHFSAKCKMGHTPRFKNGKRFRLTLEG